MALDEIRATQDRERANKEIERLLKNENSLVRQLVSELKHVTENERISLDYTNERLIALKNCADLTNDERASLEALTKIYKDIAKFDQQSISILQQRQQQYAQFTDVVSKLSSFEKISAAGLEQFKKQAITNTVNWNIKSKLAEVKQIQDLSKQAGLSPTDNIKLNFAVNKAKLTAEKQLAQQISQLQIEADNERSSSSAKFYEAVGDFAKAASEKAKVSINEEVQTFTSALNKMQEYDASVTDAQAKKSIDAFAERKKAAVDYFGAIASLQLAGKSAGAKFLGLEADYKKEGQRLVGEKYAGKEGAPSVAEQAKEVDKYVEKKKGSSEYLDAKRRAQAESGNTWGAIKTGGQQATREGADMFKNLGSHFSALIAKISIIATLSTIILKIVQAFDTLRAEGAVVTRTYTAIGMEQDKLKNGASLLGATLYGSAAQASFFRQQITSGFSVTEQAAMRAIGLEKFVALVGKAYQQTAFGALKYGSSTQQVHEANFKAIASTAMLGEVFQGSAEAGMDFAVSAFQNLSKSGQDIPDLYKKIAASAKNANMGFNEFYKMLEQYIPTLVESGSSVEDLAGNFGGFAKQLMSANAPLSFIQSRLGEVMKLTQTNFPQMIAESMAAFHTGSDTAFRALSENIKGGSLLGYRLQTQKQLMQNVGAAPENGKFSMQGLIFLGQQFGVSAQAILKYEDQFAKFYENPNSGINIDELVKQMQVEENPGLKVMLDQKTVLDTISDGVQNLVTGMVELVFVATGSKPLFDVANMQTSQRYQAAIASNATKGTPGNTQTVKIQTMTGN